MLAGTGRTSEDLANACIEAWNISLRDGNGGGNRYSRVTGT